MGSNSTQATAFLLFLVGFTCLAGAFYGGGILMVLLFLVSFGASVAMFLKCKPWEHMEK